MRSFHHLILIGLFTLGGLLACTQGGTGPMSGGTGAMDEMGAALGGGNQAAPSQGDMGADVPDVTVVECEDGPTILDDDCQQVMDKLSAGPGTGDDPDDPEPPSSPGNIKANNQMATQPTKAQFYLSNSLGDEDQQLSDDDLEDELQF